MIIKIFFYGILVALPAILLEMGILEEIKGFIFNQKLMPFLNIFVGIALVEEFLIYLVRR